MLVASSAANAQTGPGAADFTKNTLTAQVATLASATKSIQNIARVTATGGTSKIWIAADTMRKTYAYILKTNNVHVTTAQKLLGHASPMVTLSVYTKVLDQETLETGMRLSQTLGFP